MVTVCIRLEADTLSLEIEDNGRGFDADTSPKSGAGFGLMGLEERAQQVGGSLSIVSSPGRGTIVRVTGVPYRSIEAEEIVS